MELKVKNSYIRTLLIIVLCPIVVFAVCVTVFSSLTLKSSMSGKVEADLQHVCESLVSAYDYAYSGDFKMDSNGDILKGGNVISDDNSLIDSVNKSTDVDVTLFYGDTRVLTSILDSDGNRIIGTKASDKVIEKTLNNGENYFAEDVVINGKQYFGYYIPIINSDKSVAGIMFAGEPTSFVTSDIFKSMVRIIIISIIVFVVTLIYALIVSKNVVSILNGISGKLVSISEGNLNDAMENKYLKRGDEIGLIAKAGEKLRAELHNIIGNISNNTVVLNGSAGELNKMAKSSSEATESVNNAMDELSKASFSQAEETQNANEYMSEIGEMVNSISDDVIKLDENAAHMSNAERDAGVIINEVHSYIAKTMEAIERISEQAETTNKSAQKIVQAVTLITSIAEETSLLSLNASIEAARAGEHGRGFGVVASQIQTLAEQSNDSAQNIEATISSLLSDSGKTVEIMSEVRDIVFAQQQKIMDTQEKFKIVGEGVKSSVDSITAIREQTYNLDRAKEKMILIASELSALSEENAASAQQTTSALGELNEAISCISSEAKGLSDMSGELEHSIKTFDV